MKIGIGLRVAVPGRPAGEIRQWAVDGERLGFHSLGSIDRLVYDVLDPLVSLGVAGVAAAVTGRVQLVTTVLNVGWGARTGAARRGPSGDGGGCHDARCGCG